MPLLRSTNFYFLFQTHFVCVVPPYRRPDITEPVSVRLCVVSSGKTSESHQFVYTPVNGAVPSGKLSLHYDKTNSDKINLIMLFCMQFNFFGIAHTDEVIILLIPSFQNIFTPSFNFYILMSHIILTFKCIL